MPCGRYVSLWVGGLDVKANLYKKVITITFLHFKLLYPAETEY